MAGVKIGEYFVGSSVRRVPFSGFGSNFGFGSDSDSDSDAKLVIEKCEVEPENGDVIAVEVIEERGTYNKLELRDGEEIELKKGMKVLGIIGYRSAVEGYVGVIPESVKAGDELDFIGGSVVIGRCVSYPDNVGPPFRVKVVGFVTINGKRINVKDFAIPLTDTLEKTKPVVMVAGTRMDSGKTTLNSNLIKELSSRGYRVGAAKLTGFTRQRDIVKMKKFGAVKILDFSDAGVTATIKDVQETLRAAKSVLKEISNNIDLIIAELGGGLIGPDKVFEVLINEEVQKNVIINIITAMDPVAAYGSVKLLEPYFRPDVISGPATDTEAGKEQIRNRTGIRAINGRREQEIKELADFVEEKLRG